MKNEEQVFFVFFIIFANKKMIETKENCNAKNIFDSLNDSQRQAVEYVDGPQLVIAGAGSGKTRVLTYKIAYLLLKGLKPWNILALTFTNKAANEMKQRIANIVGEKESNQLNMGTFHSVFSKILRAEAQKIGYTSNYTIYDEADSRSLIKNIIREMGLDDKIYRPSFILNTISMAKNHLINADEYSNNHEIIERDKNMRVPDIYKIFTAYVMRCHKANAMDFDDLLVNTYILFRDNEDVRLKYIQRFLYVLVDEYQDTNYAQQCIIFQLTKENLHVCVVGDDAQSIYSFRGANIDNILGFDKTYTNYKLFKLERNYRSSKLIVQAANSLIKHNDRQIPKDVYSENERGEKLILKMAISDREEAAIVCKDIKRIMNSDKCSYNDFVILYRTNAQSRSFEEEMRKQDIPYKIYGGLSFYQRKEIKDIIAYFRLVVNHDDEEAFRRIINYPTRGIGSVTINKIAECAQNNGVSFWDVILRPQFWKLNISKTVITKLITFNKLISSFTKDMVENDAFTIGQEIIKSSGIYNDIYSDTTIEGIARQENLEEFLAGMQDFVEGRNEEGRNDEASLSHFLQEVVLLTDLDSDDSSSSKVSLMTIHSAKGLEFPTVFVVGLEENIFPSPMSTNSVSQIEEERRLLYVAITRAEHHCILTCAKSRFRFGRMEFDAPSRFIRDVDPTLLDICGLGNEVSQVSKFIPQNSHPVADRFIADMKPRIVAHRIEPSVDPFSSGFKHALYAERNLHKREEAKSDFNSLNQNHQHTADSIGIGSIIEHQRFGIGTVTNIENEGENAKATVEFQNTGRKQLLLKFAKFKVIKK
jgi:DNA helicase-2/ATP-dependent DNA helicase PcrA